MDEPNVKLNQDGSAVLLQEQGTVNVWTQHLLYVQK